MRYGALLGFFCFLGACSVMKSLESPSYRYRRFVEKRVQEASIFDRGRSLVSVKVMQADDSLKRAQESLTPGFSFPLELSSDQFVVAVDMTTWERFSKVDLKFNLDEVKSSKVYEVTNPIETEAHYPFAHPHFRIFIVNFPKSSELVGATRELWVQTLRGDLRFRVSSAVVDSL